jgi:hypothetical protein
MATPTNFIFMNNINTTTASQTLAPGDGNQTPTAALNPLVRDYVIERLFLAQNYLGYVLQHAMLTYAHASFPSRIGEILNASTPEDGIPLFRSLNHAIDITTQRGHPLALALDECERIEQMYDRTIKAYFKTPDGISVAEIENTIFELRKAVIDFDTAFIKNNPSFHKGLATRFLAEDEEKIADSNDPS